MKKYFGLCLVILVIAVALSLHFVSAATLFSDNFDDGNSNGWTTQNGNWSVVSDNGNYVFYQSSTSEGRAWTGSSSWTDYSVEAKVKVESFNGSNRTYVCARMTDGNNYYAASLYNSSGGKLEIRKKVKGSSSTLVSKDYSLSTGKWYKVRLEVNGSSIKMYVDDQLQLSTTDSSISSGGIGVIAYKTVSKFDDVVVYTGSVEPTPTSTPTSTSTQVPPTPSQSIAPTPTSTVVPSANPRFDLVGYATLNGGTTGGAGYKEVTVSTGSDLINAIKNGNVTVYVNGVISTSNSGGAEKIDIKNVSNVSIIGKNGAELNGIGIKIAGSSKNIIIRNLKIHHVKAGVGDGDCINIEGGTNIWVDHCELYNDLNHDKDYYDGLLDIKKSAAYVTVSWCYFHDSYKTSLVGSSDSDDGDRKVTYHHNYFKNCNSRVPSYRFGTAHIFNNYYEDIPTSGVNCRMGAKLRIENNHFVRVNNPICFLDSKQTGYWDVKNNIFENCSGSQPTTSTCSFNPPYSYTLDNVNNVKALVTQYAGVGKLDGYVPPTTTATATYNQPTVTPTATPSSGELFIKTYTPSDSTAAKNWKSYITKEIGNKSQPGTYDVATQGTGTARKVYRTIVVPQGQTYDGKGEVLTPVNMGDGSQDEGQCPVFLLEPGASLKNVTIAAPACEGVHMMGNNRLENVHWPDVGEDAASVRSYFPGGNITIVNCTAYNASDKVFQFNAPCTVRVKNVTASNIGKLIRQNGGTSFTLTIYLDSCTVNNFKDSIVRSDSKNCKVYYYNIKSNESQSDWWNLKTTPQTFGGLGNI